MPEYIRVIEVKDGCYIKEISTEADGTTLFNFTDEVNKAYQVPQTPFAEFIMESKGRESYETRLLNATHGKVKLFAVDTTYIEQPDGLMSVVNRDGTHKEEH